MMNTPNRSWLAETLALFALPATMTGKAWPVLGLAALSLIFPAVCKLARAGYESASYKAVHKSGAFEIRDYLQLTVSDLRQNRRSLTILENEHFLLRS